MQCEKILITISQAAAMLGTTASRLRYDAQGLTETWTLGGHRRYILDEVKALAERRKLDDIERARKLLGI